MQGCRGEEDTQEITPNGWLISAVCSGEAAARERGSPSHRSFHTVLVPSTVCGCCNKCVVCSV